MVLKTGDPREVGMSPEKIEYVKKLVPTWLKQDITPAFIGLVACNGVIVFEEAYGTLTPEADSPNVLKDTLFPLCSISKTICIFGLVIGFFLVYQPHFCHLDFF